jgi:GT2 family glycosyltransferase/glycosyltransferase involved in cell wall biosynthesis
MPRASVVIPIHQQVALTRACLAALERAGLGGVELVLVDNASTDGTAALLEEMEGSARVWRYPVNLGFATACNQGARLASAPVLVFLNTDTEVHEGWLEPLLAAVADPAVGVAGSRLLYPDGRVQHAGMALAPGCTPIHIHRGAPGDHPAVTRTRDLALVTGACLAVRRDLFLESGGFDEGFRNGFEDADLCLRLARRGLVARYCGDSVVTHLESRSPGRADHELENAVLFRSRWLGAPADWAEVLAEDGVAEALPADVVWQGPLFDGSPEAAVGLRTIAELAAAGYRPGAEEAGAGPCAPGVGAVCPDAVLTALNRPLAGRFRPRVLRHVAAGLPSDRGTAEGARVAVVGPGRCPLPPLAGCPAVVAIGAAAREAALAAGAPAARIAQADPADPAVGPAAERVLGPLRSPPAGIGWWGPLHGRSGYASAGRGLVAAARAAGRPVRLLPADAEEVADLAHLLDPGPADFFPGLWVLHHSPVLPDGSGVWDRLAATLGQPFVGATCFEAEGLPPGWAEACRAAVEVWVPSAFNRRTFAAAGVDPERLHAVPYPVDCAVYSPGPPRSREGPVTFAAVFEWTWRKGWDVLLRAWVEEFEPSEPVRLRILTYHGRGTLGQGNVARQAADFLVALGHDPDAVPDIELILDPVPVAALVDFYREADALVLPTRGEGAGMPVLEAMACGTPVIATAWGGHEELMSDELAFPVEVERMVEASPQLVRDNPVYAGQWLAEPSVASLRRQLRRVAEDPDEASRRAAAALAVVRERFGIAAAAAAIEARLEALLGPVRRGRVPACA